MKHGKKKKKQKKEKKKREKQLHNIPEYLFAFHVYT